MHIGCIVQARLGNSRLPRKVLADIGGWPMLKHVVRRLDVLRIPIVIAVPPGDEAEIESAMPEVFREAGITIEAPACHPDDLLKRHFLICQHRGWDAIMRVTSDCPLIDPFACNEVLAIFDSGHYDYVANDIVRTYPDGMGCEIMSMKALRWADFHAEPHQREHVSPWIIDNIWSGKKGTVHAANVLCPIPGVKGLKFSVDTQVDLDRAIAVDQAKPADYSLVATLEAYNRVMTAQCKDLMRLDQ